MQLNDDIKLCCCWNWKEYYPIDWTRIGHGVLITIILNFKSVNTKAAIPFTYYYSVVKILVHSTTKVIFYRCTK